MQLSTDPNFPLAPWVIATRQSRLALWQAEHVKELLQQHFGTTVELLGLTTLGDRVLDRTLSKVGGKGLFVKELEQALSEKRADLAVHSLKDVPMQLPPDFVLAAVLPREDPRDAWVSARFPSLQALPPGGCVGTSSLRRVVQLRALRPDLRIEPLRGNLDTRLRKLDEGQYDGIVLAVAGLKRLGWVDRIQAIFSPTEMLPAVAQGALGLEVRADALALQELLATLTDTPTWLAVQAERAVSRALGGSCSMPLAAHATFETAPTGGLMHVHAMLGAVDDEPQPLVHAHATAPVHDMETAQALGQSVAALLRARGGDAILQTLRSSVEG